MEVLSIFCIKKLLIGIFHIFNMAPKMATKGHMTIFLLLVQIKVYILATFCEIITAICWH